MRSTIAAAALLFLAAGCEHIVPPVTEVIVIDHSYDRIRSTVRILSDGSGREPQPIMARSCQVLATLPLASETDAIAQLQVKASRAGANAVRGIKCQEEGGYAQYVGCLTSTYCQAEAVRIE